MGDWSIAERQVPIPLAEASEASAIDAGIVAVDPTWHICHVNSAAARLLGGDAPALVGESLLHLLGLADAAPLVPDGRASRISLCCERPGGWLELRSHVNTKGGLVFLRDVSLDREDYLAGLATAGDCAARRPRNAGLCAASVDMRVTTAGQGESSSVGPGDGAILGHVPDGGARHRAPRFSRPENFQPTRADPANAAATQMGERILVVEDNAAVRRIVVMQLHKLGYATMEADRASAALELLDAGEPFDLLFTDLVMPGGISGQALAREALARREGLKVLFTSGLPGALAGVDEFGGPDAVLAKPYRIDTLARKVRESLDT